MLAVANLASQVPAGSWAVASHRREVPNKNYAKQLLEKMAELRPAPSFALHPHIVSLIFDQTYAVKGRGSGAGSKYTNAVARVDEKGNKIKKQRVVYINAIDLAVDARECRLSSAAIDAIAEHGPYTQDFARILPIIDPQVSAYSTCNHHK